MSKNEFDYAVNIGELSYFDHTAAAHVRHGLEVGKELIIGLGGHRRSRSINLPFISQEKEAMIRATLSREENKRVHCIYLYDDLYEQADWVASVQAEVRKITGLSSESRKICQVGENHYHSFPWAYSVANFNKEKDASQRRPKDIKRIRDAIFSGSLRVEKGEKPSADNKKALEMVLQNDLPAATASMIKHFTSQSPEFSKLQEEWFFIDNYLRPYRHLPYPVTFQTGDAVVIQSGYVLLIKRGCHPGKGLYALPGGFNESNETVIQTIYRELKKETRIKVPAKQLIKSLVYTERFDHPRRSVRERTITEAGLFSLDDGHDLPLVKAADDAAEVLWMSVKEIHEKQHLFFEDHYFIIEKMRHQLNRKDDNQRSLLAALVSSSMEIDL